MRLLSTHCWPILVLQCKMDLCDAWLAIESEILEKAHFPSSLIE